MLNFADVIWIVNHRGYIEKFSRNLLWDVDTSRLTMGDYPAYIIQRVLEYGQMDDWRLIYRYYGLNRIVEECKKMRTLDPVCPFLIL